MTKARLEPTRPHAKLKDCAGQRFIGGTLERKQSAILVFENAWCWVSVSSDEEEGPRFSEHRYSLDHDWANQEEAVRLGLLTREQVDEHRAKRATENAEASEASDRREYERLRKKYEAAP